MPRLPRIWTQPNAGVDIMNRCIQGRHLMKPSQLLNLLVIGALAKAKERYPVEIYSGVFLSSHFHLYLKAETIKAQAQFMAYFTRKLSIETGLLYDWNTSTFPNRYHAAEVSEEPEAQIERLTYHLKNGAKENLVASPLDWPGVSFVDALITGEPLKGVWIDRSAYYKARKKGLKVTLKDFTEHVELPIEPLPCWAHLDQATRRTYVLEIIQDIERQTTERHQREGTRPLGADRILSGNPHSYPSELAKSPQPRFHACHQRIRQEMKEALLFLVAAYMEASERLRAGERRVVFPENTFPPGLPFVEPAWATGGCSPTVLEPG